MSQGYHIAVNCGVGYRCSSDPMLQWLWHRQAAAALIWPLAQERPYAAGMAPKRKKINFVFFGSSCHGTAETNPTRNHEVVGTISGLAQWVRDPVLLWAVVWASGYISDYTPSLGTSICHGRDHKKKKKDLCVLFSIRFDKEYSCILIFAVTVNGILFLYFLIVSTSKTCRYLLTNHWEL